MFTFEINYWAVLVGAVLAMIIGAVWYGAFAKPWMELNGLKKESMGSVNPAIYIVPFVGALMSAFIMANLVEVFDVIDWTQAIVIAFFTWFGLNFLSILTINVFSMRSKKLALLDSSQQLIVMIVLTLLFTYWK